ncbi:uncharacterized protein [Branchiostoma lanceolatum]|uniref:Hypp4803 protein n=1 Tax=Branchiostoma lanceolatum TaxID=7740 RepID=A0A8K0ABF5_BRALA|nr:Hypp4803 [Branchiostoma lanceolatum]
MKTALLFLFCLVVIKAQFFNPLTPCQSDENCPSPETHCCRLGVFGINTCHVRPHHGWPCGLTGLDSCPCVPGFQCVLKPNSTAEAWCVSMDLEWLAQRPEE